MRRLLPAGILALALHVLFLSMEANWVKEGGPHLLQSRPIALALSYKQLQRTLSIPKKNPEDVQKISAPIPREPKEKQPKPEPIKRIKNPVRTQIERAPTVVKKPPQDKKRDLPKKVESPSQIPKSRPRKTEDPVEQKVIPEDFIAFDTAWSLVEQATDAPEETSVLPPTSVVDQQRLAALPGKEYISPPPSVQGIREAIPIYKKNPPPKYPRIARLRRYQGKVIIEVLVNPEGRVGDLRLLKSSGYAVLDRAAMKAVRNWAFEPGMRGDKKVEMWVKVPIKFQLK